MNTQRPLTPGFINKLDRYLLLNKPEIWSARTHLVLFYGLLFITLLTLIAFIVPDDPRKDSPAAYWVGFVSLISFIAFVVWIIYLLRFNVFKRYGLTGPLNRLLTFILYFISIGTIALFSYVEPIVETVRANAAYTDEEIFNDINIVNLGMCRLEYDSLKHIWNRDTVNVVDTLIYDNDNENDHIIDIIETETSVSTEAEATPPYHIIDKKELQKRLQTTDSVQKLNDSSYVFYECPDYTLLTSNRTEEYAALKPLTSIDIYREIIKDYKPPNNRQAIQHELAQIKDKYDWEKNLVYNYYYERSTPLDRMKERYAVRTISNSIDHIMERKYRWSVSSLHEFIRIFFYTTLVLTLLVFTFRHSTLRTFFFSILAAIILTILTSLMLAFTRNIDTAIFEWIIFYFIAFFFISLTAFKLRKRNILTGTSINLFLWMLPFIPLCLVMKNYEDLRYKETHSNDFAMMAKHLQWAETIGLVLLLLMVATYIHFVYRKWYAAPED